MTFEFLLVMRRYLASAPIAQLLLQAKLEGRLEVSQDEFRETTRRLLQERKSLIEKIDAAIENKRPLAVTEIANV